MSAKRVVFLRRQAGLIALLLSSLLVIMSVVAQAAEGEGGSKTEEAAAASSKEQQAQIPLKFGIFRLDCMEKFEKFDFSDKECLKFTFSKLIGSAIVVGAGILKIPQIIKILSNSSVEGLSETTLYIETTIFMQTTAVGKFTGLSFSVYGESVIIMIQNFIIILLIWQYNKSIGFLEKFLIFVFMAGYAVLLFDPIQMGILKEEHFAIITSMGTGMNVIAKVPQIKTIFENKSTGALAFFSFFLNFGGSIARLGTVLIESDDFMFRLQYIVGVVLNTIIIFQFFLYWNSSPKKPSVSVQPGDKANKMQ